MNKLIKISIIVFISITSFSIGYYFIFYLPKINEVNFLSSEQEKCRNVGELAYKADLKQYNVTSLDDPQYGYSKNLNTCIYSSGYSDQGSPSSGQSTDDIFKHNCDASWEQWVKDSYTNEKIISIRNYNNAKCQWVTSSQAIDKFDLESENLFNSKY